MLHSQLCMFESPGELKKKKSFVGCLIVEFRNLFRLFSIRPLSKMRFANIFFQSRAYLFMHLSVFHRPKVFKLDNLQLIYFFFYVSCLWYNI